ncbi:hypothetical protein [Lyngbya confervoides]|uniref:RcnB family protein n=1 Tax=Lyngbya confervoides BDU141951 TaxID=1574623 RepID=A0ABD4T8I5_9CYAN|nr:hypothetical protein [Lyngbya confervoides]MCM1984773.1 hypothetical protein [Lyngbya confervoides BDU141951]
MKRITSKATIALGLATFIVASSALSLDARPKQRGFYRDYPYGRQYGDDDDDDRGKSQQKRRGFQQTWGQWNRQQKNPVRRRRFRTVRQLPRNCVRRTVRGRDFYYENDRYYRYNPWERAYDVIDSRDLAAYLLEALF